MKARFVGGPMDGQTEEASDQTNTVRVMVVTDERGAQHYGEDEAKPNCHDPESPNYQWKDMVRVAEYRRTDETSDGARLFVFGSIGPAPVPPPVT